MKKHRDEKCVIVINTTTDKIIKCSYSHAAKTVGVTSKTIGVWSKNFNYKEKGIYRLYFEYKEIKQNKGFRMNPTNIKLVE